MEREVVDNRALEEFRERLLRWGELCTQLRELYYRYLDLAAFRSEKCYFPGRRCRRSWKREYDVGDLTLMWTYIVNTAPLCGKLTRALAEVEHEIRKRALESLEKHGGKIKRYKIERRLRPDHEVEVIRLNVAVYAYLVLYENRLYVIWREIDDLPQNHKLRHLEIDRKIVDIIELYKYGKIDIEIKEYEIDSEYRCLWFEVPLSAQISKLLGGMNRAPIALFRNLGWLLSDDWRSQLQHGAGNVGQTTMRLLDWIALATYAMEKWGASKKLLIFRLVVYNIARSRSGVKPIILLYPVGATMKTLSEVYNRFGITLGNSDDVIARGYEILRVVREEAFKREGSVYVVDDVGSWIAFSNMVNTLVVGDGIVTPVYLQISAKVTAKETLAGKTSRLKELAKAFGRKPSGTKVTLASWYMRTLLPTLPIPSFRKMVKVYEAIVNYPAAVEIRVNGTTYILSHSANGEFVIGKKKGMELYKALRRFGIKMKYNEKDQLYAIRLGRLEKLMKMGLDVRMLSDVEKDAVREIKSVSAPDEEAVKRLLEILSKIATVSVRRSRVREYLYITLHDLSKVDEVIALFKAARIRYTVIRRKGIFYIREKKSFEVVRRIMSQFFPLLT